MLLIVAECEMAIADLFEDHSVYFYSVLLVPICRYIEAMYGTYESVG